MPHTHHPETMYSIFSLEEEKIEEIQEIPPELAKQPVKQQQRQHQLPVKKEVEMKAETTVENNTNTNTIEEDSEHEIIQSMIKFFKSLLFMGADDIDEKGGKLS